MVSVDGTDPLQTWPIVRQPHDECTRLWVEFSVSRLGNLEANRVVWTVIDDW